LVDNINLTVNHHDKIALIGNNGSGKSTLLKIIAKELQPYAFLNSPIFCAPRIAFGVQIVLQNQNLTGGYEYHLTCISTR